MRSFHRSDQFVELQLHGGTVPGLCVLDQEYHQERNDGRAGIYSQLPGVAEPKQRAGCTQTRMISTAAAKVAGCPAVREVHLAKRSNRVS